MMSMAAETMIEPQVSRHYEPYRVSVQEYVTFYEQGFLVVRGLVPLEDVQSLIDHTENLLSGREVIPGVPPPLPDITPSEKLQYWLRIHMLHRLVPIHERFLLHPRILDVLEALIGPDVLALQTMLFFKQPGQHGQGYHQDSYYIPTFPDTLCGAWLAIDHADEENGCLWMTVGSQHEPIYPPAENNRFYGHRDLGDIAPIANASHTDEAMNGLTRVAHKYAGREVKVEAAPGDVVFFGGHILHRSHSNHSATRNRRSFVSHYCNARSWTPWTGGGAYEGDSANGLHILARGVTHLPYAQPRFGTPCAANQPQPQQQQSGSGMGMSMMPATDGMMMMTPHGQDDHDD